MKFILFLILILSISLISAVDFPIESADMSVGFNDLNLPQVNIMPDVPIFNNDTLNVNHSITSDLATTALNWFADSIGLLGDADPTQFSNVGGTLTILEIYCRLTGCTMSGDIDMNQNNITDILRTQYNIGGCSDDTPGTLCHDADYDTLRYVTTSGQTLQINQETTIPAKNIEGADVLDGSIVYIMGATGANPNFKLARADDLNTSGLIGVVTRDCVSNQVCPTVFFAIVHDVDTTDFSAGDHLYLSATEAGNFTIIPPEFPNVPIWVATALRIHATEGTIFVFPRLDSANGITMNTLGLIGDFVQTDYKIISEPGNDAIGQNVFTIQMNGTTGIDIPHLIFQPGGSGQASVWVRSGMVVPESVLCLNNTNRTEPLCFADESNYTWQIAEFNASLTDGADWGVTGELEIIMDSYFHGNLTINESIFFGDSDHVLKRGISGFTGLGDDAFVFRHIEEQPAGELPFAVIANKTNSDIDAVLISAQIGLNESNSILGNSWVVIVNNLTSNLTEYHKCFLVARLLNETLRVQCDSLDSGADFVVQDDIQSFGTMFADGGLRLETLADFIMNGRDVNIQNASSLHIFTPVTFEKGVIRNDEINKFDEDFTGGLGSFNNIQDDFGNWFETSNVLCADGDCANAIGISGNGNIIMEANISTINANTTSLNFIYSLANMLGANDFTVTVNNNVGSGEVTLLTDSTNDVILSSQSIGMPSSMSNQPNVGIRFNCDVTTTSRQCFVDTININGTAIDTTLTNVSGFNSVLKFGSDAVDADGFPLRGIIYNASADEIQFRGNVTFALITEQDINVTNSITIGGETITNWDNVSLFDDNVLLRNGSRAWTGNENGGGFNSSNWDFISSIFGNFTNITSLDWNNISITESQITDLVHTVNNTNINVFDINSTNLNVSIWGAFENLSITDKVKSDLIPDGDGNRAIGSQTFQWGGGYFAGSDQLLTSPNMGTSTGWSTSGWFDFGFLTENEDTLFFGDLESSGEATLTQTEALVNGELYRLRVDWSGRIDESSSPGETITLSIGGVQVVNRGSSFNRVTESFFARVNTTDNIQFRVTSNGGVGDTVGIDVHDSRLERVGLNVNDTMHIGSSFIDNEGNDINFGGSTLVGVGGLEIDDIQTRAIGITGNAVTLDSPTGSDILLLRHGGMTLDGRDNENGNFLGDWITIIPAEESSGHVIMDLGTAIDAISGGGYNYTSGSADANAGDYLHIIGSSSGADDGRYVVAPDGVGTFQLGFLGSLVGGIILDVDTGKLRMRDGHAISYGTTSTGDCETLWTSALNRLDTTCTSVAKHLRYSTMANITLDNVNLSLINGAKFNTEANFTENIFAGKNITLEETMITNNDCGIPTETMTFERTTAVTDQAMASGNGDILSGDPVLCSGVVTGIVGLCENCNGGNISMTLKINEIDKDCDTPLLTSPDNINGTSCNIPFNKFDAVGCWTNIESEQGITGLRCKLYVRYD